MDLNLEALTVQLIEKYYANDRRLFFEYMDDDIIWIGPAIRQYMEGKQNLLNAFAQESHSLQFRTAQMSSVWSPGPAPPVKFWSAFSCIPIIPAATSPCITSG